VAEKKMSRPCRGFAIDEQTRARGVLRAGRPAGRPAGLCFSYYSKVRSIAKELEDFVTIQYGSAGRADRADAAIRELDRNLGQLFHEMDEYNADFDALGQLEKSSSLFSAIELSELRPLLGLYGVETEKRLPLGRATIEHVAERQQAWSEVSISARDSIRRRIAERAVARYGVILHELTTGTTINAGQR
jgi:hypothetical protein